MQFGSQIIACNYTFDIVEEFNYHGSAVAIKNYVSLGSIAESLLLTDATMVSIGN